MLKKSRDYSEILLPWLQSIGDVTFDFLQRTLSKEQIYLFLSILEDTSALTLNVGRDKILRDYNQPKNVFNALHGLSKIRNYCDALQNPRNESIELVSALTKACVALHVGMELGLALDGSEKEMLIEYSTKFLEAGKRPRNTTDDLDILLEKLFTEFCEEKGKAPNWRQIVLKLQKLAEWDHDVILEVVKNNEDDGYINWGKGKTTKFKQIRERLTPIRKKYNNN